GGPAIGAELSAPAGLAVDAGNLFIADAGNNRIRKVDLRTGLITTAAGKGFGNSGDGVAATDALLYFSPRVAIDGADNLFIADTGNNQLRKVAPSGTITTFAGNGTPGFSGDGGAARNAQINAPGGLTVDSRGNLYFADQFNHRIRRISPEGTISTVAGNGQAG